jgi:catechol 2,3-dioxygenase-like lactoylglutathione lyase family enzyme
MPSTFRLAYVDLSTPSIDDAADYYGDVIGLNKTESTGNSVYLGLGIDHHSVALHKSDRPGLNAIGLQLSGDESLNDLTRRLNGMGISPRLKTDARPGVPALLEVSDIGGHTFHLLPDMARADAGFSGAGLAPLRMGHVAILSTDAPRLLQFLTGALGFSTTDWFEDFVTFVTCNRDHHVLNVIAAPIATMHHLAFELVGREHQIRAADLLAERQIPTLWGPARHTAGHNIASYHYGVDGALIELFNDMDVFVPELGYCEPRPWHGDRPQYPKHWPVTSMSRWDTRYEFDLSAVAFGLPG